MANVIPRLYTGFRGVDFREEMPNFSRSPDSMNMWKDYKEEDSIRTRPALAKTEDFTETVFGIYFYSVKDKHMQIIHSGAKLYKIVDGVRSELFTGCMPNQSNGFIYNNIFYFQDGLNYLEFDGVEIKPVVGYIPTIFTGCKPAGGGAKFQDINMLSDFRRIEFVGDGTATLYKLTEPNGIDTDYMPVVKVDGRQILPSEFSVNYSKAEITFDIAPKAPLTDGQSNVIIQYKKHVKGHRERIERCTLLTTFDNRVFFSGNKDYPNVLWHSSLNDPTYFSDLDYYNDGLDLAPITGIVAGNNALWVMKEPSQANTSIFYHNPVIDNQYGKVYPSVHSSISTGCIAKAINFNDDIAFFSDRGMEAIAGDVTTEQVIAHRSTMVDSKLLAESNYKDMILVEHEGYLFVIIDNMVYLADSRAMFENENHMEYEWFYWNLGMKITSAKVNKGTLYLGTEKGIYTLTDYTGAVESWWTTPLDKFGYPSMQKTSNKRGCVVEAKGDIEVLAKTNRTIWEKVGRFPNVTDYFVCRIKRKKFKDIQLKFYSQSRFSLEQATLECFVGGYVKR